MATSIDSLLEEMSGVENPIEELQVLKTALLSIPVSALRDSVSGQRFKVIFSLLNSNHRWVGLHYKYLLPTSGKIKAAESVSKLIDSNYCSIMKCKLNIIHANRLLCSYVLLTLAG